MKSLDSSVLEFMEWERFDASFRVLTEPWHEWRLNLNDNSCTFLNSHSCENSFAWKHNCETNDVQSIVIQI